MLVHLHMTSGVSQIEKIDTRLEMSFSNISDVTEKLLSNFLVCKIFVWMIIEVYLYGMDMKNVDSTLKFKR